MFVFKSVKVVEEEQTSGLTNVAAVDIAYFIECLSKREQFFWWNCRFFCNIIVEYKETAAKKKQQQQKGVRNYTFVENGSVSLC